MINIVLSANPASKKTLASGHTMISTTFNLSGHPEFTDRVLQIKTTAEAVEAHKAYAAEIAATGKGAAVTCYKHSRCKGRKPPGFDAATKTIYVNL